MVSGVLSLILLQEPTPTDLFAILYSQFLDQPLKWHPQYLIHLQLQHFFSCHIQCLRHHFISGCRNPIPLRHSATLKLDLLILILLVQS